MAVALTEEHMLALLGPLVSIAVAVSRPVAAPADPVMSPRIAQVKLAETLSSADSIDWVRATGDSGHEITFAITRGEHAYRVVAKTDARSIVKTVVVSEVDATIETGNLDWLAIVLADTTGVKQLATDEDGAIVIVTSDNQSYMAIPGRGSGGSVTNEAVEARWAAAWNRTEG